MEKYSDTLQIRITCERKISRNHQTQFILKLTIRDLSTQFVFYFTFCTALNSRTTSPASGSLLHSHSPPPEVQKQTDLRLFTSKVDNALVRH